MAKGYSPLRRQVRVWRQEYYDYKVRQLNDRLLLMEMAHMVSCLGRDPEEAAQALWDTLVKAHGKTR